MLPQGLPPGHSVQSPPWSGNSSAQTSASLHPSRSASLAGPPIHEDMVVHGLCGRVTDSARNACSLNCCCLVGGAGDLQEGYFALPDANFLSSWCQFPFSRAQNRGFCAFLASETPVFGHFEHKIGVFVLFRASEPPFSGVSSTKSGFLCFFGL